MTVDTLFDLASLTKVVTTTTAVMQLVERGKIGLEDPITQYWPELQWSGKERITLRHLLTHYSGLGPGLSLKPGWSGTEEGFKRIVEEKPHSSPGTHFTYSDINFQLLGEVVQRVSGEPFASYCNEHIFGPLGMKDTFFDPPPGIRHRIAPTLWNRKNGKTSKTVQTSDGPIELEISRDRHSTFEPDLVKKRDRVLADMLEKKILGMYGLGMSFRDLSSHLKELYDADISHSTLSTNLRYWDRKIQEDVQWKNRDGLMDMGVYKSYQREYPRFVVELPFDYSRMDREEEYGGIATNASEGGLLVHLPEFIEKEAFLKIVILIVKGSECNTIKGMAKVVWGDLAAKAPWGEHRYGLKFESFSKGSLDTFRILLKEVAKTQVG